MPGKDRSPNEVFSQSMEARVTGGFPRATPRYTEGFTRPIPKDAEGLQKLSPEVQKNMGYTKDEKGIPLKRHMKFCGGGSKPYKKK